MALIRKSELKNMSKKDRESKIKELKFELVRANVTANKKGAKTKEIKRAIARLYTFNKTHKEELKNKQ